MSIRKAQREARRVQAALDRRLSIRVLRQRTAKLTEAVLELVPEETPKGCASDDKGLPVYTGSSPEKGRQHGTA